MYSGLAYELTEGASPSRWLPTLRNKLLMEWGLVEPAWQIYRRTNRNEKTSKKESALLALRNEALVHAYNTKVWQNLS